MGVCTKLTSVLQNLALFVYYFNLLHPILCDNARDYIAMYTSYFLSFLKNYLNSIPKSLIFSNGDLQKYMQK